MTRALETIEWKGKVKQIILCKMCETSVTGTPHQPTSISLSLSLSLIKACLGECNGCLEPAPRSGRHMGTAGQGSWRRKEMPRLLPINLNSRRFEHQEIWGLAGWSIVTLLVICVRLGDRVVWRTSQMREAKWEKERKTEQLLTSIKLHCASHWFLVISSKNTRLVMSEPREHGGHY